MRSVLLSRGFAMGGSSEQRLPAVAPAATPDLVKHMHRQHLRSPCVPVCVCLYVCVCVCVCVPLCLVSVCVCGSAEKKEKTAGLVFLSGFLFLFLTHHGWTLLLIGCL